VNNFSLFDYALGAAKQNGIGVEDLGIIANVSRRDFDERATFSFRSQVPCLEYVSLLIENLLVLRAARSGRIYAGFERLSRLEPIIDRYLRVADLSERVYVFGEPDWQPPRHPNMQTIPVAAGSRMAREWFVVAASPQLHVALIAVDKGGWDTPVLEERAFHALLTREPSLVSSMANAVEDLIDQSIE